MRAIAEKDAITGYMEICHFISRRQVRLAIQIDVLMIDSLLGCFIYENYIPK